MRLVFVGCESRVLTQQNDAVVGHVGKFGHENLVHFGLTFFRNFFFDRAGGSASENHRKSSFVALIGGWVLGTGGFSKLVDDSAEDVESIRQILTVALGALAANVNQAREGLGGGQHSEALFVVTEVEKNGRGVQGLVDVGLVLGRKRF